QDDSSVIDDLVILEAGKASNFQSFLGDKKNWRLEATALETVSASKRIKLVRNEVENDYTLNWKGRGEGQFYLASLAQDLSQYDDADSALVMTLRVNQPPKKQVVLRMGCGYPCAGNADLTRLFQSVPADQWLKVSIDLACFSSRGLNVSQVDTPFLLLTSGKFSLSLADIRLVPHAQDSATIKCS
ncbi:putative glycoside hydrolase, partial [Pseudomonadales bacterium]|nr:putative glycoside hydrolase [Pseudomonadales bacterium]